MKRIIFNIITSLIAVIPVYPQTMPVVTQFDRNIFYLNPAAVGNQGVLSASFFYRSQWTGIDGKPSTQVFNVHAPLRNPSVAIGLLLEHETIGSNNTTGIYGNYSYNIKLGPGKLAMGIRFGVNTSSRDFIDLRDDADQAFNDDNKTFTLPNTGLGVIYNSDLFWVSLSIPRLLGYKSNVSGKYVVSHDFNRYEYFMAGGINYNLSSLIMIDPSLLFVYSSNLTPQFTLHLTGVYKEAFRAGLGFRTNEAIIIMMGYIINRQFNISYSYDLTVFNEVFHYSYGSHEINIQYRFDYKVNASSPRRF
ncbi:MAG: PorP/SprF family type IX secretion system membrane protein [Bacteroidales bacterium]|nr:PorP/SprF family type IX secretion system membrane protein [Bacteroidales bacterium]